MTKIQLDQLIAHARADAPYETCGIIAGKDNRALKIFSLPNNSPTPRVQYEAEPHALLESFREIESRGWEHLAIYHSHPASPAYPSPTDIARAFYPDCVYVLVSLMDPTQVVVRAFRIVEGNVQEITLEIEEEHESSRTNQRRPAEPTRGHAPRPHRAMATLSQRRPARGNARRPRR